MSEFIDAVSVVDRSLSAIEQGDLAMDSVALSQNQ